MFNVVLSVLVIFSITLPLNLFAQKFVCILNNVITLISSWYFVQLLHFIEQLSQDKFDLNGYPMYNQEGICYKQSFRKILIKSFPYHSI